MKRSDSPEFELHDEVAKIWREIESLRESVELVRRELASYKEAIGRLPGVPLESYPAEQTTLGYTEEWCNAYVNLLSSIDIVRQIFLTQTAGEATIWTIVDDPPPEDSDLAASFYDKVDTVEILRSNMPFQLNILNVSAVSQEKQLQQPDAKLLWER